MPTGYFNNKKITKVYIGSTEIYKEEEEVVEEPLFIIGTDFNSTNTRVMLMVAKREGGSKKATVGDPFYEGDTLRVVLTDWAYKFNGAPTYRPKGSTTRIPFETRTSNQEYSTTFPQGYDGGLLYPIVKV